MQAQGNTPALKIMTIKKGTEEYRKMHSEMAIKQGFGKLAGFKGKHHTEISKKKIGIYSKNRKWSNEVKEKMKNSHLGRKYKTMSVEGRNNISKGRVGKFLGKNHPFWKGGKRDYMKKHAPRPMPEQCEICGAFMSDFKIKSLCYDHDHKTGAFRGWICTRCNVAIGMVKENVETLQAIIDYIKKSDDTR